MRTLVAVLTVLAIVPGAGLPGQVTILPGPTALGGTALQTFADPGGRTSLFRFSAEALRAQGICGGARLTELAVAPIGGQGSPYTAPQARVLIGHLAPTPLAPGSWEANFTSFIVVHDLTSGPYNIPWTLGGWAPLPGIGSASLVWDGYSDIGLYYGSPGPTSGTFLARGQVSGATEPQTLTSSPFPPGPIVTQLNTTLHSRWTWAPSGPCAVRSPFGSPCDPRATSFYELFGDLSAFDLAGTPGAEFVIAATPAPGGYSVAAAPSAWRTPSQRAPIQPPQFGPLGGDAFSAPLVLPFSFSFPGGATTVVHAAANGFVQLESTTDFDSDPTPTIPELLAGRSVLCPLWTDLQPFRPASTNPTAGVYFDVEPGNQAVYITWLDCSDEASASGSISAQCVLRSDGRFEFRYRQVLTNSTNPAIVGWSRGAGSGAFAAVDPGNRDLSSTVPFTTNGPEVLQLGFTSTMPALGAPWTLTVAPVPIALPVGVVFFGSTSMLPGLDLSALGAVGCRAYTMPDLTSITVIGSGSSATVTRTLPLNPQLLGIAFHAQAAAFATPTLQSLVTSAGISFIVGR